MKTVKLNGNRNGKPQNRITAEQFVEMETAFRMDRIHRRDEVVKKLMDDTAVALYYEEHALGYIGIGFRISDGKMIEFCLPDVPPEQLEEKSWEREITPAESLEWFEAMRFAEDRLNTCMQISDAEGRWIKALKAALK